MPVELALAAVHAIAAPSVAPFAASAAWIAATSTYAAALVVTDAAAEILDVGAVGQIPSAAPCRVAYDQFVHTSD